MVEREPLWHGVRQGDGDDGHRQLRHSFGDRDSSPWSELWTDGLVCAFEFVGAGSLSLSRSSSARSRDGLAAVDPGRATPVANKIGYASCQGKLLDGFSRFSFRVSALRSTRNVRNISWRITQLVEMVGGDAAWDGRRGTSTSLMEHVDGDECDFTVADVAAPYWQRPAGPTWWCHVMAGHPAVDAWLATARWLHPAICVALRDDSLLISEKMKHLFYEVPVRVAGGLLFELLGQSVGDPAREEEDIPIVLRAWQAQNFLITALHLKGPAPNINVIGVTEVQELLSACGSTAPNSIHEVIAHLASRLARWDDRLWRKYVFGAADEIELKFVNRRNQEDLNLLCLIFNQDIRRLATEVIRVKWSLHAREEIIFELLKYLGGNTTKSLLEAIKKDIRQMIEEQEAVRGRLFTIQDVMQSTVRAWLQDRSLRITHNLTIFGGCGLVLSIITGLFGINVDGIPGAQNTPYAFALFSGLLFLVGFILIIFGVVYFGLQRPISDEQVQVRKLELQQVVSMFQHEAETHAK
uniref:Magnesium transporter CorA-like family protein n=1 Tax=Oryza brachyantha TaxID=4533 RepID=J3L1M7_ORYBR